MKTISIVNNDFSCSRLIRILVTGKHENSFAAQLNSFIGTKSCVLTSCGFAALYAILQARKELHPQRNEVIIPAYTAPGLILPLQRLGLVPILCDIVPNGFLVDTEEILKHCHSKTLAVVAVHMFGLPYDIPALIDAVDRDILIIEDCAQALGTEVGGKRVGMLAPVSFGSFSRGKNFSLYYGGFLGFNGNDTSGFLDGRDSVLPTDPSIAAVKALSKLVLFSIVTSPSVYTHLSRLLTHFKSTTEQTAFDACLMAPSMSSFAVRLFALWQEHYRKRITNGRYLFDALHTAAGSKVPDYLPAAIIAFNRFPLIVHDAQLRERLLLKLRENGIEASYMYGHPLHHLTSLGYHRNELPNAVYLADHLLTLPVHGSIDRNKLEIMADIAYAILK
jgi:dTDP-4-amino-4,6-dideoxygalactose transaminase